MKVSVRRMSVTGLVWDGAAGAVTSGLALRPVGADEVRVDVEYAGLCHSDVHRLTGHLPASPLPMVLGHEAVGHVAEAGPDSGHKVGDRVVLTTVRECGVCGRCRANSQVPCGNPPPLAPAPFQVGSTPVHAYQGLGSFATSTVVSGHQAVTVPDDVPDHVAAVLGCAVITGYGAVEYKARVQPGETVVVVGIGGIGINVVQACRLAEAAHIIAIDANPGKDAYARSLGATHFITSRDLAEAAETIAKIGIPPLDVVFDCVGLASVAEVFTPRLAYHGRVVLVGLVAHDSAQARFSVRDMMQDRSILGSRIGSVRPAIGIARLVDLYRHGRLELDSLVSDTVPLREFQSLTDRLLGGEVTRGVLAVGAKAIEETQRLSTSVGIHR
jgi:Zn-dependent alcohol dehydrogenase